MHYDLHIHSCLSPCASDDMTPNNIVHMAQIKDLDLIAITDHNSMKQLVSFDQVARLNHMKIIYGVELQTIEEVHVLAYFKTLKNALLLQDYIDQHLIQIPNQKDYFGNQFICNEFDDVINEEPYLLLSSIDVSLEDLSSMIHSLNGAVVLAHVLGRKNSITMQLGFIPSDLEIDGIECKQEEKKELIKMYPHLKSKVFLHNSDAHQLIDINEPVVSINESELNKLWRNHL